MFNYETLATSKTIKYVTFTMNSFFSQQRWILRDNMQLRR